MLLSGAALVQPRTCLNTERDVKAIGNISNDSKYLANDAGHKMKNIYKTFFS